MCTDNFAPLADILFTADEFSNEPAEDLNSEASALQESDYYQVDMPLTMHGMERRLTVRSNINRPMNRRTAASFVKRALREGAPVEDLPNQTRRIRRMLARMERSEIYAVLFGGLMVCYSETRITVCRIPVELEKKVTRNVNDRRAYARTRKAERLTLSSTSRAMKYAYDHELCA